MINTLIYYWNLYWHRCYRYEISSYGKTFVESKIFIYGLGIDRIKITIEKTTYIVCKEYSKKINDQDLVILNLISVFTFKAGEFERDEESTLYSFRIIGTKISKDDLKHFIRETVRNVLDKIDRYQITQIYYIKIKIV